MPVDIRATVACSLGTVISGNVNDEYVQGTGLIKCSGTVVIGGIITPAIGTAVTFTYTKSGVTRSIPRKLRVLSSFADPFRRTTSVELGCKLTYLSDKRDSIDWTAFDDDENTLTEADAEIITIPIRAQAVAKKCMDELGVSGTFTLTNQFSVAEFDLSPGYVQVLSDLLVSESLCGYLDANEVLQVFSLDQPGGTGPVLDVTQLVDISKIGVGQLPGEAVTVSYSSLRLKQDVQQPGGGGGGGGGGVLAINNDPGWESVTKESRYQVLVPYRSIIDGSSQIAVYNILETTTTTTSYLQLRTGDGETLRLPATRTTEFSTMAPAVIGNAYSEYLSNGINVPSTIIQKTTTETYRYNSDGIETFCEKFERGGAGFLLGSASVPIAFSPTDFVQIGFNVFIDLGRETRETLVSGGTSQVTVTTFGHWFRTLTGQQAIAQGRVSLSNSAQVASYINSLLEIGLCLVETRTDIESASRPRSAPSLADVNNATNAKGGTAGNGYRTESKAELALALGSATAQRRIELSLPYAPDDVFTKSGSTYGSVASDAAAKAQLYGRVQNRLLLGNRSGMNIQAAPEILPGAPFAPFIVKSGSTSALYRTNGSNWTFDAQGLVASTDALFWGGVGGNAGESWFPVAPGITTLPTTPGTTTVNITDASGNVVGSYEQMTVTGTVPVAQETVALQATLRVRPVVTSLPYALQQTAEVAIATRLRAVVSSIKAISIPAAAVTVAGLAPKVSTGARVLAPAATVQVAAQVPGVSSGASVAVPAAGITVAGVVPDVVGRQKTIITVPVATVQVAGLAPLVASGASVAVPAAGIAVAGLVPEQVGLVKDPNFSSVVLLLHMNGADNSTTFTDSSSAARTITPYGNVKISTAQSKFGGASALFDGAGDYLRAVVATALQFPGDFTIELWAYPLGTSQYILGSSASDSNTQIFRLNESATGRMSFYMDNTQVFSSTPAGITANQWQHLAFCRSGSSTRMFVNGVQIGSTATFSGTFRMDVIGKLFLSGSEASADFNGYIDELRITKGVARYTSNFTAPTGPFPDA